MNAGRHGVARCTGWVLVGLLCGVALAACEFRPSAPENRAEYFVEKLVCEPQAMEELRGVARLVEGESPDTLASDLPTRSALVYLRARVRLGAKLGFRAVGTQRPVPGSRVVTVMVSEGVAVLKESTAVRFQVELQKHEGAWLITRLRSD
jgi:hypothetical protein